MAKTQIIGIFALLFILVHIPFIFAIECNQADPTIRDTCKEILNLDLTLQEKEVLISNLEYSNKFFPDHEFVYQKNTNINVDNAPHGIQEYSGNFVQKAWMKIFTAMPSILYNGSFLTPESTQIKTGYNYKIVIPPNYYNSRKRDGDTCRINYNLKQNTAINKVYVNGIYQGSGDLVNIKVNSDSEIKSIYEINVEVDIDYYEWDKYCARRRNGKCVDYEYKCKYDHDTTKRDNIKIIDTLNVKKYDNNPFANLELIDNNKIRTNYSDSIEINLKDSSYAFNKFIYSINYSLDPYYVYTLKAEDYNQESIKNLYKQGSDLIVKDFSICNFKAFDFFNVIEKSCNLDYEDLNFYIKTNKLTYYPEDLIDIQIYPKDILVNLSYGNQSKLVKSSANFKADLAFNKITANYKNLHAEKVIFVKDKGKLNTIFNFSLFGFLNYAFYIALRKYFGGLI